MARTRVIIIDEKDNVATALEAIGKGETVQAGGRSVTVVSSIPKGHKLALRAIDAGEAVVKYGQPIGRAASRIGPGEHVHVHNVATLAGGGAS